MKDDEYFNDIFDEKKPSQSKPETVPKAKQKRSQLQNSHHEPQQKHEAHSTHSENGKERKPYPQNPDFQNQGRNGNYATTNE